LIFNNLPCISHHTWPAQRIGNIQISGSKDGRGIAGMGMVDAAQYTIYPQQKKPESAAEEELRKESLEETKKRSFVLIITLVINSLYDHHYFLNSAVVLFCSRLGSRCNSESTTMSYIYTVVIIRTIGCGSAA
jgi:hypothetical protein